MVGTFVLVVAGIGAATASSHSDESALEASKYQTISANYTGSDIDSGASINVQRDFDRRILERQAKQQVEQREAALQTLRDKVQENAEQLSRNQWVVPVAGYRLTARYGQGGGLWSRGFHTGLDFAGPSGSTIVSVARGIVKSVGYQGGYGNRTVITLGDGTDVWYCHQSRIAVSAGEQVDPGQIIGFTGSTGNVTGPHLHLEIHPGGGAAVDPEPVLAQHSVRP
ncbi:MAG TPA: M23 family metallopeptidase [Aeromicrobium sp.]|nr:M23 family metallopeptidase [Aeromicrobium sp.]